MLRRLQEVKPQYSVTRCVEDWRKNAELAELITAFPAGSPGSQKVQLELYDSVPLIIDTFTEEKEANCWKLYSKSCFSK